MSDRRVIYCTHPVTAEVKSSILTDGGQIIDAAFALEGERIIDGQTGDEVGAVNPDDTPSLTEAQIRKLNKAGLIAFLAANEIEAASDATNGVLIDLALPFAAQE